MAKKTINVGGEIVEIPDINKNVVVMAVIVILGLIFLFSGFYKVDASEVGIIQRFGKYVETTSPGLHFKFPFGIDKVTRIAIERNFKQEFGFQTLQAGVRTQYSRADYSDISLMLTGDLSSVLVKWIIQYKVQDPVKYLFNVRNVEETLRDVTEAVMRLVVGDHSVDEVISLSRQDIEIQSTELLQVFLDEFETGLFVENIRLQNVDPPEPVQPAFNEVNQAVQEKERIVNEAETAYNKVVPQAKGQRQQMISQAEGYFENRVNRAKGDAERFISILREYSKAKDVTRKRLYLETMLTVMPNLKGTFIVDEDQKGLVPLMQLNERGGAK